LTSGKVIVIVSMGVAYLLFQKVFVCLGKSTPFYYFLATFPLLLYSIHQERKLLS
jgi:hypothetical protein